MRVLGLCASPRLDGNSRLLVEAVLDGAAEAGHEIDRVFLVDHIDGHLRDCSACRREDGTCSIEDGYRALLFDRVLPADVLVLGTPLWWYGVSGYLKTFFDRLFCYAGTSSPECAAVAERLAGKQVVLAISAEESYPGAVLGVVHEIQELTRYLDQAFLGYVVGIANVRGEVAHDPARPLAAARALGLRLGSARSTDYRLTTSRSNTVWDEDHHDTPTALEETRR